LITFFLFIIGDIAGFSFTTDPALLTGVTLKGFLGVRGCGGTVGLLKPTEEVRWMGESGATSLKATPELTGALSFGF